MTHQSKPISSGFRELSPLEMLSVSGGVVSFTDGTAQNHNNKEHRGEIDFMGADAIGYWDMDGDGRLSDGDQIAYYKKDGVQYDPEKWEAARTIQEWHEPTGSCNFLSGLETFGQGTILVGTVVGGVAMIEPTPGGEVVAGGLFVVGGVAVGTSWGFQWLIGCE